MNRLRHLEDPKKPPRHEQIQLISILQKCTQILRQDRIFLRTRIKQNDEQVLSLFRPLKHIDLHHLQINLRKYLTQTKANLKSLQLMRFRESQMDISGIHEGKRIMTSNNSRSNLRETPREASFINRPDTGRSGSNSSRDQRCSSMTQVGKLRSHFQLKKFQERKPPVMYQIKKHVVLNSEVKPKQLQNSGSKKNLNRSENKQKVINKNPLPVKQQQSKSAGKQNKGKPKPKEHHASQHIQQFQNSEYEWSKKKTLDRDLTDHSIDTYDYANFRFHSIQGFDSNQFDSMDGSEKRYRRINYESLFTPPELLMECRKYIEKSKQQLPTFCPEDLPSKSMKFLKPVANTLESKAGIKLTTSPQLQKSFDNQEPEISSKLKAILFSSGDQINVSKSVEQRSPQIEKSTIIPMVKPTQKVAAYVKTTNKAQTKIETLTSSSKQNLPNLSQYFAEDIIDILYYNKDGAQIQAADFAYTVYSNFADTLPFEKVFEMADTDNDGKVNVNQLGALFAKTAKTKPNQVKQFFDLIDLDKLGRVTEQQYVRFISQISDSEQADFQQVRKSAEKVFTYSDFDHSGVITYWGVYLIKNTWEFQEFSGYLEQFEFSIEP